MAVSSERTILAYLCLSLIFCGSCIAQTHVLNLPPESKQMTVQDVIKLSKAGFSDDLIIQQIRQTGQRFNLSTDQLLQLKAAQVSEKVIQFMINPTSAATPGFIPPGAFTSMNTASAGKIYSFRVVE